MLKLLQKLTAANIFFKWFNCTERIRSCCYQPDAPFPTKVLREKKPKKKKNWRRMSLSGQRCQLCNSLSERPILKKKRKVHYGRDENENTLERRNKTGRSAQRLLCLCSNGTRQRERFPELVDISIWERACKKKKKKCLERWGLKKTTWRVIGQIFCVTQSKRTNQILPDK